MIFDPKNYSVVFLSYDEPNCEENYQHLLSICPTALRIHGVKGSDTAHKACANLSVTSHVIIIDGDNLVRPNFFSQIWEIDDSIDMCVSTLSWSGKNIINGTSYGNGSIKCWPVEVINNMHTHENSVDATFGVDFDCHNYLQFNFVGSDTVINGSAKQAWRAGFREAVKLCLNDNKRQTTFIDYDWRNYQRLFAWMHVGIDVRNGLSAIHGARAGCYKMMCTDWDHENVRDFDYLNTLFDEYELFTEQQLLDDCYRLGMHICVGTNDINLRPVLTYDESMLYKKTHKPIQRSDESFIKNKKQTPYDIVFISNNEAYSEQNFKRLESQVDRKIHRINGVIGIHQAHKEAAKLCDTDYFYVVDGDAWIVDDFHFDFIVPFYDQQTVHVWCSNNPVNKLIYGYGAVKLLPRIATLDSSLGTIDMTTSISKLYNPINVVSNITKFNTDPFNAWRSAFRECVKLSSQTIDRQDSTETQNRLDIWCTIGAEQEYGQETIAGAIEGRNYGTKNKSNRNALMLINDFAWLREYYNTEQSH